MDCFDCSGNTNMGAVKAPSREKGGRVGSPVNFQEDCLCKGPQAVGVEMLAATTMPTFQYLLPYHTLDLAAGTLCNSSPASIIFVMNAKLIGFQPNGQRKLLSSTRASMSGPFSLIGRLSQHQSVLALAAIQSTQFGTVEEPA